MVVILANLRKEGQMKMQKIHEIVEKRLKKFAEDNHGIFENMVYGQILKVYKDTVVNGYCICHLDMFNAPYNVKYFGKLETAKGDLYIFLNGKMDKIYAYNASIVF